MSNVYLGQIVQFGFQFAPQGFQYCNGATLPISQYSALFSLLGTQYGGNGTQTFQLPNLNGRAAIGQFQSPGTSNYVIGQSGGSESATLNITNLPAHTHTGTLSANQTKATLQTPQAGALLARAADPSSAGSTPEIYVPAGTAGTQVALGGVVTNPTGNNVPFSIIQPYLTINYCIATSGIYPSRN
ncbi:phage tail protein [Sphingomonas bacterium]|uniref:phage tail protein n=1 Tax=Sphingomonas bacterium TaxID=1895847 RepID=UPI002639582A|nr:tail fiber protein [Sphingomonas bacterium]MDB5678686.1 phage tail protein [Sphingomonas bacterium]